MTPEKKQKARRIFKIILRALASIIGFEITKKEETGKNVE